MKARKRHSEKKSPPTTSQGDEMVELFNRINSTNAPCEEDIQRYRKLAVAEPTRWRSTAQMSELIRQDIMKRMCSGVDRSYAMAEDDLLKREMGYNSSSPMERLLIENILTTRLHALHAERVFHDQILEAKTPATGDYWQRFLSSAQRRHLQAIEALARVRRLMRGGPFVQVNIAGEGGRQINVQGELFGNDEMTRTRTVPSTAEANIPAIPSPNATRATAAEEGRRPVAR